MTEINKELVEAALSKLDVDNDNHWTASGLPKVDTVKIFSSGQAIDRDYLDVTFPDFNRSSAGVDDANNSTQQETDQASEGSETGDPEKDETENNQATEDDVSERLSVRVLSLLEEGVASLVSEENYDTAIHEMNCIQSAIYNAIKRLESQVCKTAASNVNPNFHETLQNYLQSQKQLGTEVAVQGTRKRNAVDEPRTPNPLR